MSGQVHVPVVLKYDTWDIGPLSDLWSVVNRNILSEIEIRTFGQQSFIY